MLEEFAPRALHVAGKENDAADALSRLEMDPKANDTVQWEQLPPPLTHSDEMEHVIPPEIGGGGGTRKWVPTGS